MIKAVFVDIDATLADSNRNISETNKKEIHKCIEKGIKIILTSGRSRKETINRQKEVGTSPYTISANGADIYDIKMKKEIYSESIKKEEIRELIKYSLENKFQVRLIYNDKVAINKKIFPDELHKVVSEGEMKKIVEENKIIQCVICNKNFEKQYKLKQYVENNFSEIKIINESKKLTYPDADPTDIYYCDITSKAVSKGKAVMKACEYFKIKPEEIVTIGDSKNDISMFKITPNSVAMKNATVDIKEQAKYVTLSNNENGVAAVLRKIQNKE